MRIIILRLKQRIASMRAYIASTESPRIGEGRGIGT